MAMLPVLLYGDPALRKKSVPVEEIDDELRRLAEDMVETMYEEDGIGLAAPQVNRSIRMLVADAGVDEDEDVGSDPDQPPADAQRRRGPVGRQDIPGSGARGPRRSPDGTPNRPLDRLWCTAPSRETSAGWHGLSNPPTKAAHSLASKFEVPLFR